MFLAFQVMAAGDTDENVYLWNVATGQRSATLTDPDSGNAEDDYGVDGVAFSPDGGTVAASDSTGHVSLWQVKR